MIEISQNTQTRLSDARELTKILKLSKLTFDLRQSEDRTTIIRMDNLRQ